MRTLPSAMAAIIASGDFQGGQRAVSRVTVQPIEMGLYPVGDQVYATIPFTVTAGPALELPNLKSVKSERGVDSPIGQATIELWNTAPMAPGQPLPVDGQFDHLGIFSPSRGRVSYAVDVWNQRPTSFRNHLVPDRLVRVYQGYGVDYSVYPENDPNMILMGMYLIDDVTLTRTGVITVECRDFGRELSDEIAFPPAVPFKKYPLSFATKKTIPGTPTGAISATWRRPTYQTDSNVPYVGVNGVVYGHHGTDAFDASDNTYWLSVGNSGPNKGYSFEFIQGKFGAQTVNAARVKVWGGPYKVFLSVRVGNTWKGRAVIPYDPTAAPAAPNGANIPYIASKMVTHEGLCEFTFAPIAGVTAIRFTFTSLYNSGIGTYPYRAGARRVEFAGDAHAVSSPSTTTGNVSDYTDIVRLLLAYGGFYWPRSAHQILTGRSGSTTDIVSYTFAHDDPFLGQGRIWGDIQKSGTSPVADLGVEVWDKKSLLDCISYVSDILGYILYVDEQGAAQYRSPNLYLLGNWVTDVNGLGKARTTAYKTIRDDEVILELSAKLSSRSLREKVFVGNVSGKIAAVSNGRIPYPSNLRRTGGWTDSNFASVSEAQIMADLITLRQLFTFRQDSFRIAADPSIQCDDQVKLVERVTGENYFHYVKSITSNWEASTGEWTYDLTTSWLGTDPAGEWAFATTGLSAETQAYLKALG